MCVLKIRLATVLKAYNFIKKRLQYRRFPVNVLKGLGTTFFRTIPVVAFQLSFSIREEFLEKKVSGEIAFALINLFQAQIQEPANRSTTTRAFVFLAKFSEVGQEVGHDLNVCVNECIPRRDHKVLALLPPTEKCHMDFYQGVVFTAQI